MTAGRRIAAFVWATAIVLAGCAADAGPVPASVEAIPASPAAPATRDGCVVGVSWSIKTDRFGRWDEPAIQSIVAAAGGRYFSNDATLSQAPQTSNIERLIAKGATVLIVVAPDRASIESS